MVLSVSQIRCLSADQVQAANSGHPGAPMGCAPMAHTLWSKFMNYSPAEPEWFDRDRFVLSNGHACALQYSMLHLSGYDLSLDDLKLFRKCDSKTPGHPENFCTAGVEVSRGGGRAFRHVRQVRRLRCADLERTDARAARLAAAAARADRGHRSPRLFRSRCVG